MTERNREEREASLDMASMFFLTIRDEFMKAVRKTAKETYCMEVNDGMEKLIEIAYKIGFADAIDYSFDVKHESIDLGDQDESSTEEGCH